MATIDELLRRATARVAARRLPESTYRLQFHAGFTFRQATEIVPYLKDLGITDVYASPYLKAKPGSTHGYDVIDHCSLNPEIGTREDYDAWIAAMDRHGMSHILDTVPNHVGVATNENVWWNDVLENGRASFCAEYFDISWQGSPRPELHDKVLLPLLGDLYGKVLEKGELKLAFDAPGGAFSVSYYDRQFPISPTTYGKILGHRLDDLRSELQSGGGEMPPSRQEPAKVTKRRLAKAVAASAEWRAFIEEAVRRFNGVPGDAASFDSLDDLLNAQHYRLAYWRTAPDEINYRRFFDVNDLAALRMEREEVFIAAHAFTFKLFGEGKLAGLRIDHPDGLYDPKQYFDRLQRQALLTAVRAEYNADVQLQETPWEEVVAAVAGANIGRWPLYVVAEKILAFGEALPNDWAVYGTSGYDFLAMVNSLFVDAANAKVMTEIYKSFAGDDTSFGELAYRKKRLILDISLASELHMLANQLDRLAQQFRASRDFTLNGLLHALRETIACFPVYRTYVADGNVSDADHRYIETAIDCAIRRNPTAGEAIFHFIRDMLLLRYPERADEADRADQQRFVGKFQQLTSPTMAKGVEDTAFYIYNRLVSLNEVGGDPGRSGVSRAELHDYFSDRREKWPYALSASSTHDTKRSEDVRARISVLSEIPDEWRERVARWHQLNAAHRGKVGSLSAPSPNDEYLIYQTLLGAWPIEPLSRDGLAEFVKRIQAYLQKAMREAKVFTSWTDPSAEYESAVERFIALILDEQTGDSFLLDFAPFQRKISHFGMLNSLSQTLIKLTAPGVPDTYKGTELWDFSLVDPDNRRPVDYALRRRLLEELMQRSTAGESNRDIAVDLLRHKDDGRIKLWLTWKALNYRREHPGLFTAGEYLPLEVQGPGEQNLFAFARRNVGDAAVVVSPRLITRLGCAEDFLPLGANNWGGTRVFLGDLANNHRWLNVFTGEPISAGFSGGQSFLTAADALALMPVALLVTAP